MLAYKKFESAFTIPYYFLHSGQFQYVVQNTAGWRSL